VTNAPETGLVTVITNVGVRVGGMVGELVGVIVLVGQGVSIICVAVAVGAAAALARWPKLQKISQPQAMLNTNIPITGPHKLKKLVRRFCWIMGCSIGFTPGSAMIYRVNSNSGIDLPHEWHDLFEPHPER
jgi:hypothetical protein